MRNDIIKTIRYFSFFQYAPTLEEIWKFLPRKTTVATLKKEIGGAIGQNLILEHKINPNGKNKQGIYTVEEYSIKSAKHSVKKQRISEEKMKKTAHYIRILAFFPQVKLIGLSGSVAMMSAELKDDVDLFIITAEHNLWTGRCIAVLLAQFLGLRRKRGEKKAPDKICLNLIFDETDLEVPEFKKNEYVAHEILQMKPLINKDCIYERFLDANRWIFEMFPNAKRRKNYELRMKNKNTNFLADFIESLLKKLQLFSIKKHQTTEIVTDTQLWFFPDDFEKKIRRKLI